MGGTGKSHRDLEPSQWSIPKENPKETPGCTKFPMRFSELLAAFPTGKRKREGPKVKGTAFSGAEREDLAEI